MEALIVQHHLLNISLAFQNQDLSHVVIKPQNRMCLYTSWSTASWRHLLLEVVKVVTEVTNTYIHIFLDDSNAFSVDEEA